MMVKSGLLKDLFGKEERAVVVAADHGEFAGPIPGIINLQHTISKITKADGILLSPGMFEKCKKFFLQKDSPIPIVRLNWSTVYCFQWGYEKAISVPVQTPKQARDMGAKIVLIALHLHTGSEEQDAKNVEVFSKLCQSAKEIKIPVIGEYFPNCTDKLSADELHKEILIGCRIIAELGADCIKTFYTNKFREVTESCPVPVLGLGAEKLPHELQALKLAENIIKNGGKGVVFGRNVIQASSPSKFLNALLDVVKKGISPEIAAKKICNL